jgi:hypothetical protein
MLIINAAGRILTAPKSSFGLPGINIYIAGKGLLLDGTYA